MRKITLLLLFISFNSFSQIHFLTHKQEKISYSEYDSLKHLSSLDENFLYTDDVVRYYDNGTTLLYSIIEVTKGDTSTKTYLYPSKTIEYVTTAKLGSGLLSRQGTLKVNGSNYFLSVSSCDSKSCFYIIYVNKEAVYKNSVPVVK
ncbi:hypothetical protein [uncultured Flavobacterium sp.]|uniref:hypothetical protein n=1 Tax=uncultured Flavobacterium sp. TaxID=165435 RepID=UPI0025EACA77|nr:hypothetical protein [uncultured Flavobacterium sp.]